LGLEAACGLRARGLDVTLVHHRDHLMDRQLGALAAQTMLCSAEDLGVRVRLSARTASVRSAGGRVTGVELADGEVLGADLLLLACGARPDVSLAQRADLATDAGVLVTETGQSVTDSRVFAIGDCAQPPQGWTGLVAQGWSQAHTVARQLVNPAAVPMTSPATEAHRQVVRLKAVGLDVVTLGQSTPDAHTVSLHDPAGRRHIEVSVRDGRLVAATCVGAGDTAADLVVAFDRQTPVPLDPAALLLRPLVSAEIPAGTPTTMPATATVCRCNGVTKGQIVKAWEGGACTLADMAACTRASTGCGSCGPVVQGLIEWLDRSDPDRHPVEIEVADLADTPAFDQR
ncbi:MAG: FAD-dependent oxidoreductase, partial [Angustibacter sp.]